MDYLKVKNWSKFQHYKTRNPPWIKLYRSIASDYAFNQLSDVTKCHLMLIWIEAASGDGEVPNDAAYLRRRLSLKTNPDLKTLINNGWLVEIASTICKHDARPEGEKRREEQRREEMVDMPTEENKARAKAAALMARALARNKTSYQT